VFSHIENILYDFERGKREGGSVGTYGSPEYLAFILSTFSIHINPKKKRIEYNIWHL